MNQLLFGLAIVAYRGIKLGISMILPKQRLFMFCALLVGSSVTRAADLKVVYSLEAQPLVFHAAVLAATAEFLGVPFSDETKLKLKGAAEF